MNDAPDRTVAWVDLAIARHTANLTFPEFLRAVRALSARYVERRAALAGRSALDSAGKRAAFGAYYAPLHLLTAERIIRALRSPRLAEVRRIVDLGCGTGATSAAWALALGEGIEIAGVDRDGWAASEARWTWQALGLTGRARRGDLTAAARVAARAASASRSALVAGWAVNELEASLRPVLLSALLDAAARGAAVLVIEPVAGEATPWWQDWARAFAGAGGRADEWRFRADLPGSLARIDEAAGFRRDTLTAKSLLLAGPPPPAPARYHRG